MLRSFHFLLALSLMVLFAACGTSAPARQAVVVPTRTPRPTWTPLPPTPTVVPTPTPLLAKSGPEVAAELRGALDHTTAAPSYRLQYTLAAKAYRKWSQAQAAPVAKLMAQIDLDQKLPLVTMTGEYQGGAARTTMIYHCVACEEGQQTDRKFDMLSANGELYLLDETSGIWYLVEESVVADALVALQGNRLLGRLLNERIDLSTFQATRFETLDERQCTVYAEYGRAAVNALAGLYSTFGETEDAVIDDALNNIQAAESELKLWQCDDGYLHRLTIELTGFDKSSEQPFALSQDLRIYDVEAPIAINPPPGAVRLDYGPSGGELTATVFNGGNIRAEPATSAAVLGQVNAGETVYLYERTSDGRWYYVGAPAAEGWVHSSLLTVDPTVAAQVPVSGEQAAAPQSQPAVAGLTATVFNGGNVRAAPNPQGQVLDQINAYEVVELLAKTGDAVWYKMRNPRGVVGWVHSSLLTIDPPVAAQVPVE